MNRKKIYLLFLFLPVLASAQEALNSTEEQYFELLTLNGIVEKPSMVYRTLSDNNFQYDDENDEVLSWTSKNFGKSHTIFNHNSASENWFSRGINKLFSYKIYGPELFSSYNTTAPYGQNDGALWQGKGFNSSFTTGARLESYGFELTLKPQLVFSQNKDFEIKASSGTGISEYGYFWGNGSVDAPQRFGDSSFYDFDWGDSEIRWSFHTFTVGFGTQAIWTGPSYENSVMLSNNAPTFPKFDFGFRKTELIVPHFGWNLGSIETRLFYGYLSESKYFDSDSSNDHNMLSGFTFAYSPSLWLFDGLTLGFTKICLSRWGERIWTYVYPGYNGNTLKNYTGEDQFASLSADWLFTNSGLEIYGELGFDDYLANGMKFIEYARYPFHTIVYTVGLKKSLTISKARKLYGVINFEWNNTEPSQDYQLWYGSGYNFGSHYQIRQGKTNEGQWLGSGIGYGGNSQILSFKLYSPHGFEKILIGRNNPDNGYIYNMAVGAGKEKTQYLGSYYYSSFKANFYAGFESMWYLTPALSVDGGVLYDLIINPLYEENLSNENEIMHNFHFTLKIKHQF